MGYLPMNFRRLCPFRACVAVLALAAAGATPACAGGHDAAEDDSDLTSLSARQRILTFEGVVYVDKDMKDDKILEVVHTQTQSAFGPLLHAEVGANTREFRAAQDLKKRLVSVVNGPGTKAL